MANKMPLSIPADEPILLASRSCRPHMRMRPPRADTGAGAKPRAPSLHLPAQDEMEFDGEEHKDEDTEEVLTLEVDPIPEISDLPIHVVPVRNVWEMPRIWDLDAISK